LGDLTYQYDASGNRIGTGGSWARTLLPSSVLSSNYDQAAEQLAFGEVTQTFDPNGNVFTQTDATGATSYIWDARNRLVTISGPTVNASFSYDALGRRISKTINGQTTTFHYDGLDAVRETGPAGEASYLRTLAIDEALTRTDASGPSSFLADILGSTVALTDSTASVATAYTYDPFGITEVSGSASANPLQFTERENDGTGLHYYRARYYDPKRGRFTGPDPLRTGGGWSNLYAYANNNPMVYVDPMGLQSCILGSDDCTRSAGRELERRPIEEWAFESSRVVGPASGPGRGYHRGIKGSLLPTYTIYCYWKRKIQITYGYTETCTYHCTDDCRKPWTETRTWETKIESEKTEDKRTEGVLSILEGWGGSPALADIYCVRSLRP
jgi:RHS repeat-associated protein